jgi:HK97 family phage prohead protease
MSEKIVKMFKGIIKGIDEKESTLDVIVSTASIDRDKETIDLTAFKKRLGYYKSHPVLLVNHDRFDIVKQIGHAEVIKVTADGLQAKFKYYVGEGNPNADWAFLLASKGMAAFSIGFIPHAYVDNNSEEAQKTGYWRKYTDVELIEVSQVTVPSNRDAVQSRLVDADGIEKELCELVVSKGLEMGDEKEIPVKEEQEEFDAKKSVDELVARIEGIADMIDEKLQAFLESETLAAKIKDLFVQEKHYSKQLFRDVRAKSTEEQSQESDVMSAVKKGLQEALKN